MSSTPTVHRRRRRSLLGAAAGLAAVFAVAAPAAAQEGDRGGDPFPEVGADRIDITLAASSIAPGGEISYTGTGFVNDCGGGQTVTVKLNDIDILGTATARSDGSLAGSVILPASVASLDYDRYWLRFLTGTGATGCDGADMPIGSLFREFQVTVAPGSTTTISVPVGVPTTTTGDDTAAGTGGNSSTPTTAAAANGGASAGIQTNVPGTLPNNGFDSWQAATPVLILGGGGIVLLALQRRLGRT